MQEATSREISNNSLALARATELGLDGAGYSYLPYSLEYPERSGLNREDINKFKLGPPRPVVFNQGVFMTQGQHKGAMLKTLLARMKRPFKAILFIDDRSGHIEAMRMMATTVSQDIFSVHFNLSETWTLPFLEGDKSKVERDWCGFAEALNRQRFRYPETRIYRSCER